MKNDFTGPRSHYISQALRPKAAPLLPPARSGLRNLWRLVRGRATSYPEWIYWVAAILALHVLTVVIWRVVSL